MWHFWGYPGICVDARKLRKSQEKVHLNVQTEKEGGGRGPCWSQVVHRCSQLAGPPLSFRFCLPATQPLHLGSKLPVERKKREIRKQRSPGSGHTSTRSPRRWLSHLCRFTHHGTTNFLNTSWRSAGKSALTRGTDYLACKLMSESTWTCRVLSSGTSISLRVLCVQRF